MITGPAGLYRMKPAAQRLVRPLVEASVSRGVSADALTMTAVPVAAAGGLCLALSEGLPALRFGAPLVVDPGAGVHTATAQIGRAIERLSSHA